MTREEVFRLIDAERARQDARWERVPQLPDNWILLALEELGEAAWACLHYDDDQFVAEMVHVAATAVAALEQWGMIPLGRKTTMKVFEVSVTIHEKRNHPHEYGHYDCSVTLDATVESGESADAVVWSLRERARAQVELECDDWIKKIVAEGRVQVAEDRIQNCLHYLPSEPPFYEAECREAIAQLPEDHQASWLVKLEKALAALEPWSEGEQPKTDPGL